MIIMFMDLFSALEGSDDLLTEVTPPLIRCAPVLWQPETEELKKVDGPQLRTSLAEPPPPPPHPRMSLPKLKHAYTQTVQFKRSGK